MEEVTGYFPSGMLVKYHLLLDFRHYEKNCTIQLAYLSHMTTL